MTDTSHIGARSPEFALLGFLFQEAGHGYTLHRQLHSELGYIWLVSQSQTYAILKRLVMQGYLSSTIENQEKFPSRQLLEITPAGRLRFEDWLHTPTGSSVHAIRLEFITRIYFAKKLFPEMLAELFSTQIKEVHAAINRLKKIKSGIAPEETFNAIGLELRIRQLESIQTWLYESQVNFGINIERTA